MAEGQAGTQPTEHQRALSIVSGWLSEGAAPEKKDAPQPAAAPAEAPAASASPAEVPQEAAPEAVEEAQAAAEEIRRHKLKYRDEELEVDDNELKSGYLKGRDYTQKTQAIAKERQELHAAQQKAVTEAQQQYASRLQLYEKALWQAMAPELQNVDWNQLARDDPAQWAAKTQAAANVNNILQAVKTEQERIAQQQRAGLQARQAQMIQEARETLQREIPHWDAKLYEDVMKAGMAYGFTQGEVTQMVDPRAIKVLHDAMKYRALQDAKPIAEKRVAAVPKVVKPGTSEKTDANADKWSQNMTKLRKTGKDKDALAVAKMLV